MSVHGAAQDSAPVAEALAFVAGGVDDPQDQDPGPLSPDDTPEEEQWLTSFADPDQQGDPEAEEVAGVFGDEESSSVDSITGAPCEADGSCWTGGLEPLAQQSADWMEAQGWSDDAEEDRPMGDVATATASQTWADEWSQELGSVSNDWENHHHDWSGRDRWHGLFAQQGSPWGKQVWSHG